MKFSLDCIIRIAEQDYDFTTLVKSLTAVSGDNLYAKNWTGTLLLRIDGQEYARDIDDPVVRLLGQWLSKIPWILSGDTETVAFRNSEHCFAFVPAGDGVEISFYVGSDSEIEDYIFEPTTIRFDLFIKESLRIGDSLINCIKAADAQCLEKDEDCRDLRTALDEAKKSWRDYQVHQRR